MITRIFMQKSLLIATGILSLVGCGGPNGPTVYPVSGVVLRDGKPLPDVNVEFLPEKGRPSFATTDDDGKFVLEYMAGQPGALNGPHKIRIVEQFQGASADGDSPVPTTPVIPPEPKSYELLQPTQVNTKTNKFTIDVATGTATPST